MTAVTPTPRVHVETRAQWRRWLTDHHQHARSVWVVSWRKHTGRPAVSYDDAVTEALAFGWVDSKPAALDHDRTMLYYSPRKAGSGWSRPNKLRIQTLERDGLMTPAGRRVIDAAKADGSWTMLDDVEDLVVPDDLASALDTVPEARRHWDAFPRSVRRGILEWIVQARRPQTRATRVAETARQAGVDIGANQWTPREK